MTWWQIALVGYGGGWLCAVPEVYKACTNSFPREPHSLRTLAVTMIAALGWPFASGWHWVQVLARAFGRRR